jgi:hypothetical protein
MFGIKKDIVITVLLKFGNYVNLCIRIIYKGGSLS